MDSCIETHPKDSRLISTESALKHHRKLADDYEWDGQKVLAEKHRSKEKYYEALVKRGELYEPLF